MIDHEDCPGCGHPWSEHGRNDGCWHGWEHGADGVATVDGCYCLLVHSRLSK